jgi:hypothetical protein
MIMENFFDHAARRLRAPRPSPRTVPAVTTRNRPRAESPAGIRITAIRNPRFSVLTGYV